MADDGVEGGGGVDAEVFLLEAGSVEVALGGGLGGAEGAGGGGVAGDGAAEGDEDGLGGLGAEAGGEVADGVELFFAGAGGEGLAAMGEEGHVEWALVGGLATDGGVPTF